jgi:autotransporter-associated beta strand protein
MRMTVPSKASPARFRGMRVLLAGLLSLGAASDARAFDGTWVGATPDWADPSNWTSNPDVPDGTATFSNSGSTAVDSSVFTIIGAIQFTAAPNAQAFTITNSADFFFVNGAGIFNDSINVQTINILGDGVSFLQSSTASGGSNVVSLVNSTVLNFLNSSTAGSASLTNNVSGLVNWNDTSSAGTAVLGNDGTATFNDNSTAAAADISNVGTLQFYNSSSAGSATILNSSTTLFANTSTAGSAIITNDGTLQFTGASTAGSANITNNATMNFLDGATAGTSGIVNNAGGVLTFANTSTAQGATIANSGDLLFSNTSRAGTALITNDSQLSFLDASSADQATISNNAGILFGDASSADHTTITATANAATIVFFGTSTAGNATIQSAPGVTGSAIAFADSSTAGGATIRNAPMGFILFLNSASAGNANILNEGSATLGPALTGFGNTSTAGSATITNRYGGVAFDDASVAGTATILNSATGLAFFSGAASADHATIINGAGTGGIGTGGLTTFSDTSTAANATITTQNGGAVAFFGSSSGGAARFITEAGGAFDISQLTAPGTTAGSIEGAGSYYLGDRQLTVGGNNLSTIVSGVISDGSCGCFGPGGTGGSLVKVGSGTLTLTGASTYTGTTTISGGALQIGNGGATGSIGNGDIVNDSVLAFNRSDLLPFTNIISGTGAVNQIGTGTTVLTATNSYTGPTTVSAGQLTIAAGGSITSSVSNAATFENAGTVTGNLSNSGTATNSATISGMVANSGLFRQTAGIVSGGITNTAIADIQNGAVNGAILNNAGTFFAGGTGGTVTSDSTFANASSATLSLPAGASYTIGGLLTNSGTISVVSGATLNAAAGVTNTAGGVIRVFAGGTLRDDLNNAGIVVNNGAYLANVASNTGSITNAATGTWTGNAVSSGTIVNNGIWNGSITSSGSLSGTGSLSAVSVTGGTFAPGNATAGSSMTVASLTLASAAQFIVQVNPTTASFANVSGSATLGGAAVTANFANGSYISRRYNLVNAAGVVGTFGALTSNNLPANFTSNLSYDAAHAYLDLTLNFTPPPGPAAPVYTPLNINQSSVANTLVNYFNSTGGIPRAFGTLLPTGLSQASGETSTGTQQTTFDAMNLFLNLLTDPFVAGRGMARTGPVAFAEPDQANAYAAKRRNGAEREALGMITKAAPQTPTFEARWNVWAAGFGGSQRTDGHSALGTGATASRIYGGAVGADYWFAPQTVAGFALAGGGTQFSVADAGSGKSDLFQAGAFIRHTEGPAYITGALAYGWQDITTDRAVTMAGIDRLRAQFDANAYAGRIESGYRLSHPWLAVTPYAAGQFTTFDLPAYAESAVSGATTFALAYGGQSVTSTRSELGLRSDKSWVLGDGVFTLRGRAAWAHEFNPDRNVQATFQTLPGASFVVNGAPRARDAALTTGSAEWSFASGLALAATFEGEFSGVTRSYAGKGLARYTW